MTFYIQHDKQTNVIDLTQIKDSPPEKIFETIISSTGGQKDWDQVYLRWVNEPFSALDIDTDQPIEEEQISYYAFRVNPSPCLFWRTHGGGMRFIYHNYDTFEAKELAILALGYMWKRWPQFSYEVKNDTRHPGYAKRGELVTKPHSTKIEFNSSNYIESYIDLTRFDDEVAEWLQQKGLVLEDRFPHSLCPFNPDDTDSRKPVAIYPDGIFCFKCQAKGMKYYAKWGELLGKRESTVINKMLLNLTHWEHAEIIFKNYYNGMPHLDLYYRTLIKLHLISHYKDIDRTRMVQILRSIFNKGNYLLRYEGYWATVDHRLPDNGMYLKKALEQLPIFMLKNDRSIILALTSDTVDFTDFGYPPITAVHGFAMNGVYLAENKYYKTVDSYKFNKPEYLPGVTDQQVSEAWSCLETVFPGVNRELIYLLIAGKGITENPYNIPHLLYIWGVTGAAKTSSVKLAGAIVGSNPNEFSWQKDEHYLGTKFLNGCRNSAFILINECAKNPLSYQFLLSLDSNATVHQLHHGPVKLGRLPLIVLTDITIAEAIQNSAQYRRRMYFVHLAQSVEWKQTMHKAGLTSIGDIRDKFPRECNTILSYCVDRFFTEKKSFDQVFKELGFSDLQDTMEYINNKEKLGDMYCFYLAFCKYCKPVTGSDKARWKGKDTRVFSYIDNNPASELWREYTGQNPRETQPFLEQDWGKILQVDEPVILTISKFNGSKCGMRFIGKSTGLVNQEILGDRFNKEVTEYAI